MLGVHEFGKMLSMGFEFETGASYQLQREKARLRDRRQDVRRGGVLVRRGLADERLG